MMTRLNSQVCLIVLTTTLVILSDAFKLPLEVKMKDSVDPWIDMKSDNENDEGQRVAIINSIPLSSRRLLKYPDSFTDGKGEGEVGNMVFPVVISFRHLDGEFEDGLVSYETGSSSRLERFYKHSTHTLPVTGERIVFPNEEGDNAQHEVAAPIDDNGDLRLENKSRGKQPGQVRLLIRKESSNEISNKTSEQHMYSLESLAQIVRHILFRSPISDVFDSGTMELSPIDKIYEYEPMVVSETEQESTSSELDVRDQSLYNGPKFRTGGSGECAEGYKKTRNGLCQKPSRRLLTVSR